MISAISKVPVRCWEFSEKIDLLEIRGEALDRSWRKKLVFINAHYASG